MEKRALVVRSDNEKAELAVKRECACVNSGSCAKTCFTLSEDTVLMVCENTGNFKKGDIVTIKTNTSVILMSALLVFILPFVPAVISFAVLNAFIQSEIVLYIVSVALFAAVFLMDCIIINNYLKKKNDYKIIKIENSSGENDV